VSPGPDAATNSWDDVEQELGFEAPALDLLRQASERPAIEFDLDYNLGFNLPLTHLAKMKQAALLLSPAAVDALHRGDSAGAVTNLLRCCPS
jgi:hypothetical protein